ncbi:hypothetical protein BV20DRAFT_960410 [Pilatotrama ljubarskyi]|nr:hypothetical protein BV20DRAFT_960410 [Pilatotrama ljubarskyi]
MARAPTGQRPRHAAGILLEHVAVSLGVHAGPLDGNRPLSCYIVDADTVSSYWCSEESRILEEMSWVLRHHDAVGNTSLSIPSL